MDTSLLKFRTKQERRFMLIVPLIFIPFLCLIFWAFKGIRDDSEQLKTSSDVLLDLPAADDPKEIMNSKLEHYALASEQATKKQKLKESDPYFVEDSLTDSVQETTHDLLRDSWFKDRMSSQRNDFPTDTKQSPLMEISETMEHSEQEIYDKLDQLNQVLKVESEFPQRPNELVPVATDSSALLLSDKTLAKSDVDRLEELMDKTNNPGKEDKELLVLRDMLETIRDIQSPESSASEKLGFSPGLLMDSVYEVSPTSIEEPTSFLPNTIGITSKKENGFFSLSQHAHHSALPITIPAVIHQDQNLRSGSVVKLRLLQAAQVNGILIPKDSFVFGVVNLQKERLEIHIRSIRHGHSLIPVELRVYDLDGISGIHIPGAITRELAKESASRSIQGINLSSLDPTLVSQATLTALETAKSLINRKAQLIQVSLKAGYQVLLLDQKQKHF